MAFRPLFCKKKKDLLSGKMKGIGKEQGGLYILQASRFVSSPNSASILSPTPASTMSNISFHTATTIDSSLLWHSRLGHASISRLNKNSLGIDPIKQ